MIRIEGVNRWGGTQVQYIWGANSTKENWGFILIYAKNALNKINRIGMLWTVRHLWTSLARLLTVIVTIHC